VFLKVGEYVSNKMEVLLFGTFFWAEEVDFFIEVVCNEFLYALVEVLPEFW